MEIITNTPHGEIDAFGLSPHGQSGATEWTAVNFVDPDKFLSPLTIFAGIPVGSTPELWGTYTPHLSLHNFSSIAQTVTANMSWMINGSSQRAVVGSIALSPGESASLTLDKATGTSDLLNTLTITGSDPKGGIAAQLMVEDSSQDLRFQIIGKSGADDTNIGMHPWRLSGSDDDILLLYNETSTAQNAYIRIGNGQQVWTKTYSLQPASTMRLSLRAMLSLKTASEAGQKLMAGMNYGSFSWSADDQQRLKGRLIHIDDASSSVESFQCAGYQTLCNGGVSGPSSLQEGVQGTWTATYQGCINNLAPNLCSGVASGEQSPSSFSWNASGFSGVSDTSQSYVSGTASALGNNPVSVNMTSFSGCVVSGYEPVTVSVPCPTGVTVSSQTQENLISLLPHMLTGIGQYNLNTVTGPASDYNNATIHEVVNEVPGTNTCGHSPICAVTDPSGFVVDSAGESKDGTTLFGVPNAFYDEYFYLNTISVEAPGTSCSLQCTQTYQCGGVDIGTRVFTLNYTLKAGNIGIRQFPLNPPKYKTYQVTNVTITKQ